MNPTIMIRVFIMSLNNYFLNPNSKRAKKHFIYFNFNNLHNFFTKFNSNFSKNLFPFIIPKQVNFFHLKFDLKFKLSLSFILIQSN